MHGDARILIAGQAPGRKVHASGIPWDDASGERLREWLGIPAGIFYDPKRVALLPMGFCYPGTGKSGDLPPRPECETAWRSKLMARLPHLELVVAIGQYAVEYHLETSLTTLTETVQAWRSHDAGVIALPHPSPRNNIWLKRNPWFEEELLPVLRRRVKKALK
jgi:uracil-DNA glycosylase